jgi:hypothetical protein
MYGAPTLYLVQGCLEEDEKEINKVLKGSVEIV